MKTDSKTENNNSWKQKPTFGANGLVTIYDEQERPVLDYVYPEYAQIIINAVNGQRERTILIENLKQEIARLKEDKDKLEILNLLWSSTFQKYDKWTAEALFSMATGCSETELNFQFTAAEEMWQRLAGAINSKSSDSSDHPRIYSRCPACGNDTLTIHDKHLLCTWHECPNPSLVDNLFQLHTLSQLLLDYLKAQQAAASASALKDPNGMQLFFKADALHKQAMAMAERLGMKAQ